MKPVTTRTELLAPAGSPEALEAAVAAGADAVYFGASAYNARMGAKNFGDEELADAIRLCRATGVKTNITVNTLAYDRELAGLIKTVERLYILGCDALIVADLGAAALIHKYFPDLTLHASTQVAGHNLDAAEQLYKLGFSRMVAARELSYQNLKLLCERSPIETELFIHGAVCVSQSGQCLLSSMVGGRSGNRGECAQPCRWKYALVEEHRPGQYMEIGETPDNGSYILNANDLCTAPFLDLICKAGVDSLKIEGRAKTFYYVASVTSAYRRALDTYLRDPFNDDFRLPPDVIEELDRTSHRHYSPGFYFGKEQALQTPSHTYVRRWDFIGTVDDWADGVAHCTQRGKFAVGDTLEVLQPDGATVTLTPAWIENEDGQRVDATPHPMMRYTIPCETPLMPCSLLRMRKQEPEA